MERRCPGCGAIIQDNIKVCGNCGRIIPPRRANVQGSGRAVPKPSQPSQRQASPRQRAAAPRQQVQSVPRAQAPKPKTQTPVQRSAPQRSVQQKKAVSKKRQPQKATGRLNIKRWLKIALVIIAVYLIISLVQIFRVKFSTYDFKTTDMKMSQDNYGQAIDVFFDSGSWVYNPFTCTVKYSGETVEGDEYELKFSALGEVGVKSIEVDGEPKDKKQFETVMMGMFI